MSHKNSSAVLKGFPLTGQNCSPILGANHPSSLSLKRDCGTKKGQKRLGPQSRFWGHTTRNSSGLSPKRDCGSKRVKTNYYGKTLKRSQNWRFFPRKPAIYSTELSKAPVDSSGCSPKFSESFLEHFSVSPESWFGLFVHISSFEGITLFHQKSSEDP